MQACAMKTLSESIIGKRGSTLKLRQWDIVRLRDGKYRMCITDKELIAPIPYYGEIDDEGILLMFRDKDAYYYSIINVSEYKDLKFTGSYLGTDQRNGGWDIVKVYRPNPELIQEFRPKYRYDIIDLTLDRSLSRIASKSELIYSR